MKTKVFSSFEKSLLEVSLLESIDNLNAHPINKETTPVAERLKANFASAIKAREDLIAKIKRL